MRLVGWSLWNETAILSHIWRFNVAAYNSAEIVVGSNKRGRNAAVIL
jgi:hypothetical protein